MDAPPGALGAGQEKAKIAIDDLRERFGLTQSEERAKLRRVVRSGGRLAAPLWTAGVMPDPWSLDAG